jgi:hypothetical protein
LFDRVRIRKWIFLGDMNSSLLDRAGSMGGKTIKSPSLFQHKSSSSRIFCDNEHSAFSAFVFRVHWRCPGAFSCLNSVLYSIQVSETPVNRKVKLLLKLVSSLLHETQLLSSFVLCKKCKTCIISYFLFTDSFLLVFVSWF